MGDASLSQPADGPKPENAAQALSRDQSPSRDLSDPSQRALYAVGYAHLDTQWRWDFPTTIDEYIYATLVDNFALIDQHPEYAFNFTGSVRYEMMKEYYPNLYERLKQYVADGRWHVSGSSVDEGDVNVPSPESIIRQVLYGNKLFRREFGKESVDYMLPDCFGFPASMPSIWAHCGLLGFSTQKLTWGSAVGVPFKVGVWEGPDGDGVIAALDPGPYVGAVKGRVDQNPEWGRRVEDNGERYGIWADYHYYGTGDQGGAPRADDVANYTASASAPDREMDIILSTSDLMYRDITPSLRESLPRFKGDMLLTEHSAGTLTSQSTMKRWNRQAEQLADAAERAATMAWLYAGAEYPREQLERSWVRVLANQMHDILPGTSIPRAYRYSWNDEVLAMNGFADVLTTAVGQVASQMDTQTDGQPLVVFNPLSIERQDIVQARISAPEGVFVRVFGPDGLEVPSQEIGRKADSVDMLVLTNVAANSMTVFEVRHAPTPYDGPSALGVSARSLESERYRVMLNDAGDVASIFDKANQRELLAQPHTLQFTYEKPRNWPAWNMDWADRQLGPTGQVDGAPTFRVTERGPVRVAIEVSRWAEQSQFTQRIRLSAGAAGDMVEFDNTIDWQSAETALRAAFPLTVSNPSATYNWGLGTIERGNNDPKKYEVPSHEWFDLTDMSGAYGVTIVEDSKFGSDKPADDLLRLTLLYSPGVRNWYMDQHSQDWGVHEIRYGVAGHAGDWRKAGSEWIGRRFNQPLRAFLAPNHDGPLGRSVSLLGTSDPGVDIRTVKMAEDADKIILRLQEIHGVSHDAVNVSLATPMQRVREVDGQERALAVIEVTGGALSIPMTPYAVRALEIEPVRQMFAGAASMSPVALAYDTDVASTDPAPTDGAMDAHGRSYPAEMFPTTLVSDAVPFQFGGAADGQQQAVTCRGQEIALPEGDWDQLHLVVSAMEDADSTFTLGDASVTLPIQSWTGFIGQWDDRIWDREFPKVDHKGEGRVTAIAPGYIKRAPVVWFATHRHHAEQGNEAYRFSYLYRHTIDRPDSATTLRLPYDERVKVFAVTVASSGARDVRPAWPLYDTLEGHEVIPLRHDYNAVVEGVFTGHDPIGIVETDRERDWALLSMGAPNAADDIGPESGFVIRAVDGAGRFRVHPRSGMEGDALVRLADDALPANEDDINNNVWFDNEGRFTLDLKRTRIVEAVRIYSWHRANRAPQFLSLWGAKTEAPPPTDFGRGESTNWALLGIVDTRELGDGDLHGSLITGPDGAPLGAYRHLLWITEDVGEGTFLSEIDVKFGSDR
jgi:alpha-mannosidase